MAGRIRTVKPEWLEHERLASCSDAARVLSIALVLLADDHGNGRGSDQYLASQVWTYSRDPRESFAKAREALAELSAAGFVVRYQAGGQTYYHLPGWKEHQRVDKPGKPRVPTPSAADLARPSRDSRETLAPDHDHDHDHEGDHEGDPRARAHVSAADVEAAGQPCGRDAVLTLAARIWFDQESRKAALRAKGIDPTSRSLGPLPNAELAARVAERAADLAAAEADCRHVLEVGLADAEHHSKTLKFLDGRHWEAKRFAAALSVQVGQPLGRPARAAGRRDDVGHYKHTGDEVYAGGEVEL